MRYDTTLKELLQYGTPQLWQLIFGQQVREILTVELPSVKIRKPDFVAWLESGVLAHVDLQFVSAKQTTRLGRKTDDSIRLTWSRKHCARGGTENGNYSRYS